MVENDRNEEWRPVVGYEGVYSVSSLGRIRRELRNGGTRILRQNHVGRDRGYRAVMLCNGSKNMKVGLIHRLVLSAFCGPEPKLECNHRNGNKADNCLENLEWVTGSQNQKHAFRVLDVNRRRGEEKTNAKLNAENVREIRQRLTDHESCYRIAKSYGVSPSTINEIKRGRNWKSVAVMLLMAYSSGCIAPTYNFFVGGEHKHGEKQNADASKDHAGIRGETPEGSAGQAGDRMENGSVGGVRLDLSRSR